MLDLSGRNEMTMKYSRESPDFLEAGCTRKCNNNPLIPKRIQNTIQYLLSPVKSVETKSSSV